MYVDLSGKDKYVRFWEPNARRYQIMYAGKYIGIYAATILLQQVANSNKNGATDLAAS